MLRWPRGGMCAAVPMPMGPYREPAAYGAASPAAGWGQPLPREPVAMPAPVNFAPTSMAGSWSVPRLQGSPPMPGSPRPAPLSFVGPAAPHGTLASPAGCSRGLSSYTGPPYKVASPAVMPRPPLVTSPRPAAAAPTPDSPIASVTSPLSYEVCRMEVGREVNSVAISPDGRRVVAGLQDHTLQVWDLQMQAVIHVLRGHKYWVNSVAWSLDGVHIASGSADKTIKVWNGGTGACLSTLQGHMLSVAAVAFSDDALRLASGSWDKTVCIWDVELGKSLIVLTGHADWVHAVAWAPGGRQLASASSDHSVRVWNAISGLVEQVLVGHLQTVSSVSFARNGVFLASGSLDRTVRIWNLEEGTLAARLLQETDEGSVNAVAFTPDSERLVVGCGDRSVKVWNVRTGRQDEQLHGHEESVRMVCVSLDGNHIVSCSHDLTLRVWRMPPRRAAPPSAGSPGRSAGAEWLAAGGGSRLPRGLGMGAASAASVSFKELHDRLRNTEEVNQRLRQQLSEAQLELESNTSKMQTYSSSREEQDRELHKYREMISSLIAEKERLEHSFAEMRQGLRQDLAQLPTVPAGSASVSLPRAGHGQSGGASGTGSVRVPGSAATRVGVAFSGYDARGGQPTTPGPPLAPFAELGATLPMHQVLPPRVVRHAAGTPAASTAQGQAGEENLRRHGYGASTVAASQPSLARGRSHPGHLEQHLPGHASPARPMHADVHARPMHPSGRPPPRRQ